jgi:hypothetical protein
MPTIGKNKALTHQGLIKLQFYLSWDVQPKIVEDVQEKVLEDD